jgi:hypothetical protein
LRSICTRGRPWAEQISELSGQLALHRVGGRLLRACGLDVFLHLLGIHQLQRTEAQAATALAAAVDGTQHLLAHHARERVLQDGLAAHQLAEDVHQLHPLAGQHRLVCQTLQTLARGGQHLAKHRAATAQGCIDTQLEGRRSGRGSHDRERGAI